MKINRRYGFTTCGNCGESFQKLIAVKVERVLESGEVVFDYMIDLDGEATFKLSDEHHKKGCEKKQWSWEDVSYIEET